MTLEQKLLRYWKNNLADAMRASLEVTPDNSYLLKEDPLFSARIDGGIVAKLFNREDVKHNKARGITRKDSPEWELLKRVAVMIAPFKVNPRPEHLKFMGNKGSLYPFWVQADLLRSGELHIPHEYFPLLPRDYLSPIGNEQHDFVFSSVDAVDKAASFKREAIEEWEEYRTYIEEIFLQLTGQPLGTYSIEDHFIKKEPTIVVPEKEIGAANAIIDLYNHLLDAKDLPPLLLQFISVENQLPIRSPIKTHDFIDAHLLHLGQMGNSFPLSISQRKSLYTLLSSTDARVFAVNGPPGTGKTTLLQSIVANEIVLAAIAGEEPPLILACSANNQAVTNINESFVKADSNLTDLKDRWIPDFSGYASYLPASDKSEKDLTNLNYIKLGKTSGTFSSLENADYINRATEFYLVKGNQFLQKNYLQVSEVIQALQFEIKEIQKSISLSRQLWLVLLSKINIFKEFFIEASPEEQYFDITFWQRLRHELESIEIGVRNYFQSEPLLRKVLCFFSFSRWLKKRELSIKPLFRDLPLHQTKVNFHSEIALLEFLQKKIALIIEIDKSIKQWTQWKAENKISHNPVSEEKDLWNIEYAKLSSGAKLGYFFDEIDISLRHRAFHLAIHYWEGRWLDKMSDLLNRRELNNGLSDKMERWKTRAMLTPCFVSTFYMAPKFFSYSVAVGQNDDGTTQWTSPPLRSFIDLLIVDEAGQVSPEIGTAIFGLAKKAVIVGDVKQIEPVWNITPKLDMGNLVKHKIISTVEENMHRDLSDNGFLSSNGSIMKMAQNACDVVDPSNQLKEKGTMLIEHRRCFNEIISYCNDLAYGGMLKPMKGKANSERLFEPMLLIHNEGHSLVTHTDRSNESEALQISKWLMANKLKIEQHYNAGNTRLRKPLEDIVGIITPFKGQKRLLLSNLSAVGLEVGRMKIGTVHALQGAERDIVLFSPVYGDGDVSVMFFDRDNKPNILNVAVSRAKESFIVFGNQRIFNSKANTPSGKLIRYLKTT